jgi:hypothetical protein
LTAYCASALAAQSGAKDNEKVWTLDGLRAGYCVNFLMDPKDADDELKQGYTFLRADQDQTLHPALIQVVRTQAEFAPWVPSTLCFYYVDVIRVGQSRIFEKNRRTPQMLAIWSLASLEQGSGARRDLVVDLYTNSERLRSIAARNLLAVEDAEAGFRPATDTTGHAFTQKIDKARLVWIGRTADDSVRVAQPVVQSWQVRGSRGAPWKAELGFSPAWRRSLVGSLRVEGKGDLAKALKSSPIRFVGPYFQGGKAQVRFAR